VNYQKLRKGVFALAPYLVMVLLAIQLAVLVTESHRKDRQMSAVVTVLKETSRVSGLLVERIKVLEERLTKAEKRIQRLDMTASWYGPGFHGKTTASGSIYDQAAMTCAHRTLPFGTVLVVEYRGKRATVIVTDRGPYVNGRDIDLSKGVADAIGITRRGVDKVVVYKVEV
jgi:rare lipoprotein A